jgi:hypothetical protein
MKSSKKTILERVEAVFDLLLGGAEFHDILQFASAPEQAWGVSDRMLRYYKARAEALMKLRFDARADHLLSRHLLQRRRLYAHAMEVGDYRTALAVLGDEAKLEGLYPVEKREHTGKDGKPLFPLEMLVEALQRSDRAAEPPVPDRNGTPPAPRTTGLPS